MSAFILHAKSTAETAGRLGQFLGIGYGRSAPRPGGEATLIRWGSVTPSPGWREINSRGAVSEASNKMLAFGALGCSGIAHPDYCSTPPDGQNWPLRDRFPVLGRLSNGMRGRDIVVFFQMPDILACVRDRRFDFFTAYIPKLEEYRVHIINDRVVKVAVKEFRGNNSKKHGFNALVWNKGNGYFFKKVLVKSCPEDIKSLSRRAIRALSLDFGAVDILSGCDGKYYVLEVNTAPGLSPVALSVYGKNLGSLAGIESYPGAGHVVWPNNAEEE